MSLPETPSTNQIPDTIDLYAAYAKEREGLSVIRMEGGFLSYRIQKPDVLFVNDVYVCGHAASYVRIREDKSEVSFVTGRPCYLRRPSISWLTHEFV